jgi:hypothetical protein
MQEHINAPIRLILLIIAGVLFGIAAIVGPWNPPAPAPDPWYRGKLIAAGLMFWVASQFF